MNLRKLIKVGGGLSSSVILLIGLNGCSSTHTGPAPYSSVNGINQPPANFESSTICANNAFLQKYQCSFVKVEQAARSGDPDAQYALGYLYYYGIGTAQDRQTGLLWIRKAAAQGQPVAQQALQELSTSKPKKTSAAATSNSNSNSNSATSLGSTSSTSSNSNTSSSNTSSNSSSSTANAQPDRPLTDYLPNYGEKRVDTTATPSVNLSAPPAGQN